MPGSLQVPLPVVVVSALAGVTDRLVDAAAGDETCLGPALREQHLRFLEEVAPGDEAAEEAPACIVSEVARAEGSLVDRPVEGHANAIDELQGIDERLITRRLDDLQPRRV